ncbi:hypothetical protein [Streptomyces sp. NPDC059909]|uniref:hypothetical protein n=1 Tax=Streptomyces sp. NPDC059909 TaxID=3346998 RepID=UPI003652E943
MSASPKLTKRQKAAKKKLNEHMTDLKAAISRRDWSRARAARAAAWDEVGRLADHLTRDERRALWKYKLLLKAGEEQARQARRRNT